MECKSFFIEIFKLKNESEEINNATRINRIIKQD
mgnify:FL=1